MTAAHCPATGRLGSCPWLALESSRRARLQGWIGAGIGAAALLGGLAVAASLAAPAPQPEPFALSLMPVSVAVAPTVSALPDPAPQITPDVVDSLAAPEAAPQPARPEDQAAPQTPLPLPDLHAPDAEVAPAVMPAPEPPKVVPQKAEPVKKAVEKKVKKKPAAKANPAAKDKPTEQPAARETHATSGGAKAGAQSAAQSSPKAWGNAVLKKIRKTPRKAAPGRGTVQIGFVVATDGSLSSVRVLKSSGNAAIDAMGLDHIRRAAPFAPPPEGASRNLGFIFEVR